MTPCVEILLVLIRLPLELTGHCVIQMDKAALPDLRRNFEFLFAVFVGVSLMVKGKCSLQI